MNKKYTIISYLVITFLGVLSTGITIDGKAQEVKAEDITEPTEIVSTEVESSTEEIIEEVTEESTEPETVVVKEQGFKYYQIPEEYTMYGGSFPEDVQRYLWSQCKERELDYYIAVALIERESGYKSNATGDSGASKGYMQVQEKWHKARMVEEGVTDLYDPYGNIRVALNLFEELQEDYGASGNHCVLMVYNMGAGTAKELWGEGIYSTEYSRRIINRAEEIKQELQD